MISSCSRRALLRHIEPKERGTGSYKATVTFASSGILGQPPAGRSHEAARSIRADRARVVDERECETHGNTKRRAAVHNAGANKGTGLWTTWSFRGSLCMRSQDCQSRPQLARGAAQHPRSSSYTLPRKVARAFFSLPLSQPVSTLADLGTRRARNHWRPCVRSGTPPSIYPIGS